MKKWMTLLCIVISLFSCFAAYAGSKSAVGLWRTNRSILKIYTVNGELRAKVVKVLVGKGNGALCTKCEGENKNKPVVGMTVIWGLKPAGNNTWSGGKGLDPDTGKTYQCSLTLSDNAQLIKFQASRLIFTRTLEWHRVASAS
jgi:uncharacterized protein (DUF2147 family)